MIQRRTFLSLAGFGILGAGAGLGAAWFTHDRHSRIALHAFLPDDPALLERSMRAFAASLPDAGNRARLSVTGQAVDAARDVFGGGGMFARGTVSIRTTRLTAELPSDILVTRSSGGMLVPGRDLTEALSTVRSALAGRSAVWQLGIEYDEGDVVDRMLAGTPHVVIEDERGVVDRFAVPAGKRRIELQGPAGKSVFALEDGAVRAVSAPCRHTLCVRQGAISRPGDVIACAPNRVIVRLTA